MLSSLAQQYRQWKQFDKKTRTGQCGGDYGWDCICTNNDEKNEVRSFNSLD